MRVWLWVWDLPIFWQGEDGAYSWALAKIVTLWTREFPQGKFELVPTVVGKKAKAMGLSNSFLDIHYQYATWNGNGMY